jgi:hypothetical protein
MSLNETGEIIRASEIGQYAYCARAWWLGRVKGYRSTNVATMREGTSQHLIHGQAVERYYLQRRVAVALLGLASLAALLWLFLSLSA